MRVRATSLLFSTALALSLVCAPTALARRAAPAAKAKWTVMLYMNGDNDLDPYALLDFEEMARVRYSPLVNVVVQLDRRGAGDTDAQWGETRRFVMRRNLKPTRSDSLPGFKEESNMGDPATLGAFVSWARQSFPAERHMLVIWSHGDGWRRPERASSASDEPAEAVRERERAVMAAEALLATGRLTDYSLGSLGLSQGPLAPQFRTISGDETNNHDPLYVREIQDALEGAVRGGRKLDVLGFDACLMQMIETGYALRNVADVMVGSEELEPSQGWCYGDWLQALTDAPDSDATSAGKLLVESYRKTFDASTSDTTLSAVRLAGGEMDRLAGAVSQLSRALTDSLDKEAQQIKEARRGCKVFATGRGYHGIDLHRFVSNLAAADVNPRLRATAADTARLIERLVIHNYAGSKRQGEFDARGLSIYFPLNKSAYTSDKYSDAYSEKNRRYVIQFVTDHFWDNFLHAYFERV